MDQLRWSGRLFHDPGGHAAGDSPSQVAREPIRYDATGGAA
jgi:hypothetical protein